MDQYALSPDQLRKDLITILNEIYDKKGKLKKNEIKKHNGILQSFLMTFIPEMKKRDSLFDLLFQCIYFTGSYYSNLRVAEPNEYDLNLLLKFPFKDKNISVEYQPQVPSYAKYKVKNENAIAGEDGLNKLFEDGYLIPGKVSSWIQSVIDKARETYRKPKRLAEVNFVKSGSSSGPAKTISIVKKDGGKIDIDLVPVIECSIKQKPPGIDGKVYAKFFGSLKVPKVRSSKKKIRQKPENIAQQGVFKDSPTSSLEQVTHPLEADASNQSKNLVQPPKQTKVQKSRSKKNGSKLNQPAGQQGAGGTSIQTRKKTRRVRHRFPARCFLVPKPYKLSKQAPVNDTECGRLWRAHYPKAEEVVIHDLGCVKTLIKLLKLLRDKENWQILASYYLKTIVMWMIIKNPCKEGWEMNHLGEKFLEALDYLQICVERRHIPYFFNPNYNLLEKLGEDQANNIQNKLGIIIRDIERDHENLYDIFGC